MNDRISRAVMPRLKEIRHLCGMDVLHVQKYSDIGLPFRVHLHITIHRPGKRFLHPHRFDNAAVHIGEKAALDIRDRRSVDRNVRIVPRLL